MSLDCLACEPTAAKSAPKKIAAATFAHVALNCRDLAATERFYTEHFGFRRARLVELPNTKIVFIKLNGVYLELFESAGQSPAPVPTNDGPAWPGVRHIAFQVANVDEKLAEMGSAAKITFGPFGFDAFIPGWRTAWIADPDGNIVEISQGFRDE
jgi:glyoxylase I family protein